MTLIVFHLKKLKQIISPNIIYLEVYFHVSLYKYTGNIRIDLLIFLFLVTLAVGKTLLEVVICEF